MILTAFQVQGTMINSEKLRNKKSRLQVWLKRMQAEEEEKKGNKQEVRDSI